MDQKPGLPSQNGPELPPPLPHPVLVWRQHDDVTRLKETHRLPGEVTLWACSSQARPSPQTLLLHVARQGWWPLASWTHLLLLALPTPPLKEHQDAGQGP